MATPVYSGLSTINGVQKLYNIDLINQDLLNNINTRKGERLMDPEYGSIVWDLLFELQSASIISEIENDLTAIINAEPRVQLQTMQIVEQDYGYAAFIMLYYVTFKTTAQLQVDFNTQTAQAALTNTTGS